MTRLALRPYHAGDSPDAGSVPVTAVVLTRDEEPNIKRCLTSLSWASQILIVDSGSIDNTVSIAKSLGAEVVEQPWLGYSAQRECALRLPQIQNDWVYFVDADEWVSPQLATEIESCMKAPSCAAFSQRLRLVFQDRWIRHGGWYSASLVIRLVDRRYTRYGEKLVGERANVNGSVDRLRNDIVDDDLKGISKWLKKHLNYAELEAEQRPRHQPITKRLRILRTRDVSDGRPLSSVILRDIIFPSVPAKPLVLFLYMYIVRLGILDGKAGLRFCFFHAWFEVTVSAMRDPRFPRGIPRENAS